MLKILRDNFEEALKIVEQASSDRVNELQIYRSIFVEGVNESLTLSATNSFISAKFLGIPVEEMEEAGYVLDCSRLSHLIKTSEAKLVSLQKIDDSQVKVKTGGVARMNYLGHEVFPSFVDVGGISGSFQEFPSKNFLKPLRKIAPFCGNDFTKIQQTGPCIFESKLYATDSFQGVIWDLEEISTDEPLNFHPSLIQVFSTCGEEGELKMGLDPETGKICFSKGPVEITSSLFVKGFPYDNMDQILERCKENRNSVRVGREAFDKALNRISPFVDDSRVARIRVLSEGEVLVSGFSWREAEVASEPISSSSNCPGFEVFVNFEHLRMLVGLLEDDDVEFKFSTDNKKIFLVEEGPMSFWAVPKVVQGSVLEDAYDKDI